MSAAFAPAVAATTESVCMEGVEAACFHCGEKNFQRDRWSHVVDGRSRQFCCAGCQAVAEALGAAGLASLYARRTDAVPRPNDAAAATATTTAETALAEHLVRTRADGRLEVSLLLEGMSCGACGTLCEAWLRQQPGVCEVAVNDASQRVILAWDPSRTDLARLLRAVGMLGFAATPYDPAQRESRARAEGRRLLLRVAIALLAMMQVMMFAGAAYWSDDGVAAEQQRLLDWASMVLTLPVVLFSAAPFWRGAWRDLSHGRMGMDVPIVLGLGAALGASLWSTWSGQGSVYYDSITMFVALVLGARYLELVARQRAAAAIEGLARRQPDVALRLCEWPGGVVEIVPASTLESADHVLVRPGAVVPVDGTVIEGRSEVDEAMLTGEARSLPRGPGEVVLAGSINRGQPLVVRVDRAGAQTRLASILRLTQRAAATRPAIARTADRIAAVFVTALLAFAAVTALAWLLLDPARALAVTVAVLVVSCPCALALATPAAATALTGALARQGVVFGRGDVLEVLARVSHVVFDKTGTLTRGEVRVVGHRVMPGIADAQAWALAAGLEARSEHPLARGLTRHRRDDTPPVAVAALCTVRGQGVAGAFAGESLRIGTPDFVAELAGPMPALLADYAAAAPAASTLVALGGEAGWRALFVTADALREDAAQAVAGLRRMGIATLLLSGDRREHVEAVAGALDIVDARWSLSPEDKCQAIAALQREGAVVAMVGDGINDAPALAQAQVSFSLASGSALAQWTADVVVLADRVDLVGVAIQGARRAMNILRQNFAWALVYNLVAIPAAAFGFLSPLLAAVGMAASSLVVVGNALRLTLTAGQVKAVQEAQTATLQTGVPAWKS